MFSEQCNTGNAIIYRSELDYISRCILDCPDIETGGQLFGFWSAKGEPVVLFAIGPGPHANHEVAFFNQDLDYLTKVGGELVERFGLHHIGEWHSHHRLGLARPSGHDAANMSTNIERENLGRFLLCIGNCDGYSSVLNAYNFVQGEGDDYVQAAWHVVETESPFRKVIDRDGKMQAMIVDPFTQSAVHGANRIAHAGPRLVKPDLPKDSWLQQPGNGMVLKRMRDALSAGSEDGECKVQLDRAKNILLTTCCHGEEVLVVLPPGFPEVSPLVVRNGMPHDIKWSCSGDVFADFERAFEWLLKKDEIVLPEGGTSAEPQLIKDEDETEKSAASEPETPASEPEAPASEPTEPIEGNVEDNNNSDNQKDD